MIHVKRDVLDSFPPPELIEWKLRTGKAKVDQISQEALRVGTLVDRWVMHDLRPTHPTEGLHLAPAGPPEGIALTSSEVRCWNAWLRFKEEHPALIQRVVAVQEELHQGEVVGHPDITVAVEDWFGTISLKCASQIRPEYWTQEAGYSWVRHPTRQAKLLAILRLDKVTGTYEYVEMTDPIDIAYEIRVWEAYLHLYRHRQRAAEWLRQRKETEAFDGVS